MNRDQFKQLKRTLRFFAIKALVGRISRLPATAVPKLKRLLLKVFPLFFAREIERARELLPVEFAARRDEIISAMADNQVATILEILFYEKLLQHDPQFISVVGKEHLDQALAGNKGLIILSAHFGNWEVMSYTLARMGIPLNVMARPQAVDQMTEFMNSFREKRNVKVIMHNAMPECLKLLGQGKPVGLLSDLNAREWGYQVTFFGRNASFYSAPVILSVRSGAPLIPAFTERQKNGRLILRFEEPVQWIKGESMQERVQKYVKRYEAAFRRRPDQWCWFHERYEFASLGRTN